MNTVKVLASEESVSLFFMFWSVSKWKKKDKLESPYTLHEKFNTHPQKGWA